MRTWSGWRVVLAVGLLVLDSVSAAHWSWGAYLASAAVAGAPALCWLLFAPPGRTGTGVGVVLVAFSVVPGLVLGPGGLQMYQVSRAGTWTVVLYLPVTFGVVGIGLLVTALRVRRDPAVRGASAVRVAMAQVVVGVAVVVGLCCSWLELALEDGETPVAISAPVAGLLPDDVRIVSSHWDGGSSVDGEEYDLAGIHGQSPQALAEEVSRSVAGTTGWPLPVGFGGRCYRAGGFSAYSGRYCVEIQRPDIAGSGIVLKIQSWDNRFGDFDPSPG